MCLGCVLECGAYRLLVEVCMALEIHWKTKIYFQVTLLEELRSANASLKTTALDVVEVHARVM
jgi:hypothetical protein